MANDAAALSKEHGALLQTTTESKASKALDKEQLEELTARATAKYAMKDYRNAAELYSRATELQAEIHGEMSPRNADLLYAYGRCLYHVAVLNSEVLGSKLAGETKEQTSKSGNSSKANPAISAASKEAESSRTQELVTAVVEEKNDKSSATVEPEARTKPYFVFTGDDGYDDSDEEADEEDEDNDNDLAEDDDFSNAFEVLDLARVLLQRQIEEKRSSATPSNETRQLEERLADTYDLQAEISLEGEQFSNAATDLRAALDMKKTLYPFESSLVAEAHYKLSLALEFAAVTHHKDATGEIDSSKPAIVDQKMRNEAAEQMEQAIGSCRARIALEEDKLASGCDSADGPKPKITRQSIDDVIEMVGDMEQRLNELREAPVTVNDPRGTGAPDGAQPLHGVLGEILGESAEAQKERVEAAIRSANDLTGLVKRKRKPEEISAGAATPEKRARTEDAENGTRPAA